MEGHEALLEISPEELRRLVELTMEGDEEVTVLSRKLIATFLGMVGEMNEFAQFINREMGEVVELAKQLPGAAAATEPTS